AGAIRSLLTSPDPGSIRRFNLGCRLFALLWLLVLVPVCQLGRKAPIDFGQFYLGGQVARLGAWEDLYPQALPGSLYHPGFPQGSTMRPLYARLAAEHGVGDTFRYFQPPPFALALVPLGYLDFPTASWAWLMLMAVLAWGVAVQAGRFFAVLADRPTRGVGALTLLVGCWPRMIASVRWGNISPLVTLLIGAAVLGLLHRRDGRAAAAIVLGAIAKYATLVFLPLVVAMRRWRVIGGMLLGGGAILAVSLAIMGTGPYIVFLNEVAPTLGRPAYVMGNQSPYGLIYRATGQAPLPPAVLAGLRAAQLMTLAVVLGLIFTRPATRWRDPAEVVAAALALLGWLLVFSPIFWHHYSVYLGPFWAWAVWEALRWPSRRPWVVAALVLVWVPWSALFRMEGLLDSYIFLSTLLMLGLALARLA
ncbi:MAG: DUF2029 domain-containing protein, partial [Isosphaeraceae bacterium]|nr:DUF2029 domain-containing protein [Isosphaeraceae bacterium]